MDASVRILMLALAGAGLGLAQAPNDPVGRLIERIARGEAQLVYRDDGKSYLPSLLAALDLNTDSQTLVLAKNSFQAPYISPANPRAIYFNDHVSVAFIPEADLIEIASLDPQQGVIFYTLDAHDGSAPHFQSCNTSCHGIRETAILMVQSTPPRSAASAFRNATTDHRTPFENRWGGWYVTGTHGGMVHRGNEVRLTGSAPDQRLNRTSLSGQFDTGKYVEPTSDIVALMTLEHQTRMTNLIMAVNRNARAVAAGKMNVEWLDRAIEDMVGYMLFTGEAPLPAPVKGVSTFTETFPRRGPRDAAGRSLRDFDLKTRMFRYPLSYMIYSQMFDGMEAGGKARVYRRLFDILTGKVQDERFARLPAQERQAILEIVRDTKQDLPEYWRAAQ